MPPPLKQIIKTDNFWWTTSKKVMFHHSCGLFYTAYFCICFITLPYSLIHITMNISNAFLSLYCHLMIIKNAKSAEGHGNSWVCKNNFQLSFLISNWMLCGPPKYHTNYFPYFRRNKRTRRRRWDRRRWRFVQSYIFMVSGS